MGWLPIASAPKDGTWVALWVVHPGDQITDAFERFDVGYWLTENANPGWERKADWEKTWSGQATHWMPLPAAPTPDDGLGPP